MKGRQVALILGALLLAPFIDGFAQQAALAEGDRIRVQSPTLGDNKVAGTLVALDAEQLTIRVGGDGPLTLDLASLSKFEVHRGQRRGVPEGAAIGLLGGGVLSGLFLASFCGGDNLCQTDEYVRAFAYIALPTALVGAVIGSFTTIDRWEEVPLDSVRLGFGDGDGLGVTLAVSISL